MNLKYEGMKFKCLITNCHIITQNFVDIKKDIIIKIENRDEIQLN